MLTTDNVRETFAWDDGYPYEGSHNGERAREFDAWLATIKAQALRDAADALQYPKEGAAYAMWASGVGGWLRSRALLIEEQARENVRPEEVSCVG